MITIPVPIAERAYEVVIGVVPPDETAGRLARALGRTSGIALLVDGGLGRASPRVDALAAALGARLPGVRRLDLPAGEACKTLAAIEATCQWLAAQGFDREASVVALGGGAACDHAGFGAGIYLRGIRYATCPTTLLAMVDASVGGKTGADLDAGKNLVGVFHQPRAVVADLGFLGTLPARERAAGMAEVVKAGLIGDADLYARLEADADRSAAWPADTLAEIVAAAVRVKVAVVAADEREGDRRAILNFGHTVGHAIEAASGYDLLHGEAVALGMLAALALGARRGTTPPDLLPRTRALLARLGLPVDVAARLTPDVLARVQVDKKRHAGRMRFVLCPRLGDAVLEDIPLGALADEILAAVRAAP